MIVRSAAFACTAVLLVSCGRPSVADGKRFVPFGENCYRIPQWNMALNTSSSGTSLTLKFSNTEIVDRIAGYQIPRLTTGEPEAGMMVGLFLATAEESAQEHANKKQALNHDFYDLWYGLGQSATRTVEPIPGTGLYRVWPLPNGYDWMVVTRAPDPARRDTHLADDFWIGGCVFLDDRRIRSCTAKIEQGLLYLDIFTIETNLPYRKQITQYITQKLESWKVPCTD